MHESISQYLEKRSFTEVASSGASTPRARVREFENGDFRLRVIAEGDGDEYVQLAPLCNPDERLFLPGLVAFLTSNDSITSQAGPYGHMLDEHHVKLAGLLACTPEGVAMREQLSKWLQEFAGREQARMAHEAHAARLARKPWWKVW